MLALIYCADYTSAMSRENQVHFPAKSLKQKFHAFVRKTVWNMDIHPRTWISETALIDRTWPKGIHIGKNCVIDEQSVVLTHDVTRAMHVDTWIGDDCFIGARAIVLPGVRIGRGCIVEPGSLVNRDVPDGGHVIGNPARPVDPNGR